MYGVAGLLEQKRPSTFHMHTFCRGHILYPGAERVVLLEQLEHAFSDRAVDMQKLLPVLGLVHWIARLPSPFECQF